VIRRADPADLAAIGEVFRAASLANEAANPHAVEFYRSVGFVDDGVAQPQFGPAPRMRLSVRGA